MSIKTFLILGLLLFTGLLKAEDLYKFDQKELDLLEKDPTVNKRPILTVPKKEIKSIDEELKIKYMNEETGIYFPTYSTNEDSTRYSMIYFLNGNIRQLSGVSTFEFLFGKKISNYWIEIFGRKSDLRYKSVTFLNGAVRTADSEGLLFTSEPLFSGGFGIAYRSTFIQNFIKSGDYFETTSAHINYNLLSEVMTTDVFTGFGFKADFGIHKRFSRYFHLGAKFSYNIAALTRDPVEGEDSSTLRSLVLHWIGIGIDLTYYL